MSARTNYGRRRADRWRIGIGVALGVVLTSYAMYTAGCDAAGPSEPDPVVVSTSEPVAAAPAPAATPSVVQQPASGNGRECSLNGATLTLKNTDPINHSYFGWSTDFDQATTHKDPLAPVVRKPGDTYDYTDPVGKCRQLDIAHEYNGTALCHAFLDKDGKEFIPSRNPEKVTACRTTPCDPESEKSWIEDEEYRDGEWGSCQPQTNDAGLAGATTPQCSRKKTRTWTSTNICTQKTRTRTEWVYEECECPCVETQEPREYGGSPLWNETILEGKCEVEVGPLDFEEDTLTVKNCRQIGTQEITTDWLCKADDKSTRNLCRNVVCPKPPCVAPIEGTKLTQLSGGPDAECAAFGNFKSSEKQESWPWDFDDPYLFLICKAGTDHIVEPVSRFDTRCSNRKSISHVTACVCK